MYCYMENNSTVIHWFRSEEVHDWQYNIYMSINKPKNIAQFVHTQTDTGTQAGTYREDCGIPCFVTGIWRGTGLGWNEIKSGWTGLVKEKEKGKEEGYLHHWKKWCAERNRTRDKYRRVQFKREINKLS